MVSTGELEVFPMEMTAMAWPSHRNWPHSIRPSFQPQPPCTSYLPANGQGADSSDFERKREIRILVDTIRIVVSREDDDQR